MEHDNIMNLRLILKDFSVYLTKRSPFTDRETRIFLGVISLLSPEWEKFVNWLLLNSLPSQCFTFEVSDRPAAAGTDEYCKRYLQLHKK